LGSSANFIIVACCGNDTSARANREAVRKYPDTKERITRQKTVNTTALDETAHACWNYFLYIKKRGAENDEP
jgi:hypothetical protein